MLPRIIAFLEPIQIGFDFGSEQAQHRTNAVDINCAIVLSTLFAERSASSRRFSAHRMTRRKFAVDHNASEDWNNGS
jgi:hypothetical protein